MADADRLQRRIDRERRARKQAEALIEDKSRELYEANKKLEDFNQRLEARVEEATAEIRAKNVLLERRVGELAALNSVATALCALTDVNSLLARVIDVAKDVMHAEAASLLLLDEAGERLHFQVARGSAGEKLKAMTVRIGQGIAGSVAATGEAELVLDAYADPRFDASYDEHSGVRTASLLAVPVKVKDEIIGVAEVINKVGGARFDRDDLVLFESLVAAIGVALENARLFDEKQAMAEELREALEQERRLSIEKEKMGAYIPRHVVDEISRNREKKLALGGKSVTVTVLFSDLKGFTRLSERMEPQRVIDFINTYMTAMTEVIEAQDGIIDKFIGDGIMAIFTEQEGGDDHAVRAARAGVELQGRLNELRARWRESRPELCELAMRVGINTGEVVSGNIGSTTRMDYTVVGDNVNVAARIESVCEPGSVFVSESCFERLGGRFPARRIDPIHVKNREQPVQTYALAT